MNKEPSEFEKFKKAVKVIVNAPKEKTRKPKKKTAKKPKKKGGGEWLICHVCYCQNKDADLFKKAAEYYYTYGDTKNGDVCLETSDRITLPERIREIVRIWTQPAKEVWSSAIGYRPDETYTRFQIVRGVHIYSKRIR